MKTTKLILFILTTTLSFLGPLNGYSADDSTAPIAYLSGKTKSNRLSFYFQNIEMRALLQLIAKNSGMNFIISDAVKGVVTINLQNVTWEQALSSVLRSHGLAARREANVIYISTLEDITSTETKRLQADQAISNLKPLTSRIIRLRYANATDVAGLLKGSSSNLLTARGEVAVDARTNSLIVRDVPSNLSVVATQIRALDIPARQVLIEARIVNLDTNYELNLGVKFGVSNSRHLSGTFIGASQINSGVSPADLIDPLNRLNFDLTAAPLQSGTNPGTIAIALAHLGPVLLDLELSALEGENHAKVIARPRVITSNQKKAIIQTGQEIPYQQATSSGATSVTFKNAVLSLEITPQITPNNKIILTVKANEDTQGPSIVTGGDATTGTAVVPIINTQSVESNVLLNDRETIVLGGIYRQTKINTVDRIPFLGEIPLLGFFFRRNGTRDEKHELLIFITPKIIRPLCDTSLNYAYKGE